MGTLQELKEIRAGQLSIIKIAQSDLKNPERARRDIRAILKSICKQQLHVVYMAERVANSPAIIDAALDRVADLNQQIKVLQHREKIERLLTMQREVENESVAG